MSCLSPLASSSLSQYNISISYTYLSVYLPTRLAINRSNWIWSYPIISNQCDLSIHCRLIDFLRVCIYIHIERDFLVSKRPSAAKVHWATLGCYRILRCRCILLPPKASATSVSGKVSTSIMDKSWDLIVISYHMCIEREREREHNGHNGGIMAV